MRIDPLLTRKPVTGAVRHVTDDLLAETYLAPRAAEIDLRAVLGPGAPWSESLAAAPEETVRAVEAGLIAVARATPWLDPSDLRPKALPESRARDHLAALRDLWRDLGTLPGPLPVWRHVLRSDPRDALEPLPLLAAPCPFATPAEAALAAILRAHHGGLQHEVATARAAGGTALRHVQDHLGSGSGRTAPDETLTCYGLRDPREEAEFAAALARAMLEDGTVASAQEIGVLVPDDPAYSLALPEAFDRVGLPLSGLPREAAQRDLGGELLSLLLAMLAGPTPRTALASLCTSPLMPWPAGFGRHMALEVMENGVSRMAGMLDEAARAVLDALRPCDPARRPPSSSPGWAPLRAPRRQPVCSPASPRSRPGRERQSTGRHSGALWWRARSPLRATTASSRACRSFPTPPCPGDPCAG